MTSETIETASAGTVQRLSRTVVRNSAAGIGAQLAIKLLSFGFSVFVVRSLGAEAFGQYAAVLAYGALFVFLGDLGLSPYTVRQVARWRAEPDGPGRTAVLYGNVLRLRLVLSVVAALLLVASAWATGRPPVMVLAIALGAVGLMMYGVQGTCEAVLAGFERLDLAAGAKVVYQVTFVVAGGLALWLGAGYFGLIGANLLGIALMTYLCWRGVRHFGVRAGDAEVHTWARLVRAGVPFGVIGFTLGLSYKFDSVLLNVFRGDTETGYYSAAYNLVFSTVVLSNVLNTSLYPSLARQAATAPELLPRIYERSLRYLLVLSVPIAVGAWALANQIVPFLFTDSYLPAVPALRIVIWVVPLMFASEFLGYIVVVQGKEGRVARAVAVSTGLNVGLNLLLVPRFGFIAAAAMTVLTEGVLVGQYLWLLREQMRQIDWWQVLVRTTSAALLMGGAVSALHEVPLLANVALGAALYVALLMALGVLGRDELRFVRSLRTAVPATPAAV